VHLKTASDLLHALSGSSYLADPAGRIVALGGEWSAVGRGDAVAGSTLFDWMDGDEVRSLYRSLHAAMLTGTRSRVTFACRCDAPDVERGMRVSLGAVRDDDRVVAVLYQFQIAYERERPPLALLAPRDAAARLQNEAAHDPVTPYCSFCVRVRQDGAWRTPEEYYRRGGSSRVALSHGVCEECRDRIWREHEERPESLPPARNRILAKSA
jgi:hypothetical protein